MTHALMRFRRLLARTLVLLLLAPSLSGAVQAQRVAVMPPAKRAE